MDENNKENDLAAEIERVFLAGNRKNDPAAQLASERFKAQIQAGNISPADARGLFADDAKISALIEKTRQDTAAIETDPRAASKPSRSIDKDLAAEILESQAQMRAELVELRAVTTDLKAVADETVAATEHLKDASKNIHAEVQKAVSGLTIRAALRTAAFLTPFSLVSSVAGNDATPYVNALASWTFGWKETPAVSIAPVTMNFDNRQYWTFAPPLPFPAERPFIIPEVPQQPVKHPQPVHSNRPSHGGSHRKARARHSKAPG